MIRSGAVRWRALPGCHIAAPPRRVAAEPGDLVVVLHLLGNHGPAYYRRYPPEFRRFQPACDNAELTACSPGEIVNAYDNAILYTDHVLAAIVAYLQGLANRDRPDLSARSR